MAADKLVDSGQLDSDLEDIADAIRTKGGTSAALSFPSGFINAIGNISSGADCVKGSFTVGNSETYHTINFGKTFSKYLFIIEADDESKEDIAECELTTARAYLIIGRYPGFKFASEDVDYRLIAERVKPSDSTLSTTNIGASSAVVLTDSSITINCYALTNTNAPNYLYQGLTYNYYVFEMT